MSSADDLTGQTLLGKFQILQRIGAGGMGAVYEVEHLLTGHRRALKVLHQHLAHSAEGVSRFVREAGMAGRLRSPHLPETYDVGRLEDGSTYILMELLRGNTLHELLAREGQLPAERVIEIAGQVCDGLATAHDGGILHRDLKPDNIFISTGPDGQVQVKILDFGVATYLSGEGDRFGALTQTGVIVGTPLYMAPEQAAARPPDVRSDLYSLGVIMHEALSGVRVFEASSLAAVIGRIASGQFTPLRDLAPHIDPRLEQVVHRAMSFDPAARFSTATELRDALDGLRSAQPAHLPATAATAVSAAGRSGTERSRAPRRAAGPSVTLWGCIAAGALLLGAATVGTGLYAFGVGATPPPTASPREATAPPALVPVATGTATPPGTPTPTDAPTPTDTPTPTGVPTPTAAAAPTGVPAQTAMDEPAAIPVPPATAGSPVPADLGTSYQRATEDSEWARNAHLDPERCVAEALNAPESPLRTSVGMGCAATIFDAEAAEALCAVLVARHPDYPTTQGCRELAATVHIAEQNRAAQRRGQ